MIISNLQVPFETMILQNPNLVADEPFGFPKTTHSDSQFPKTLTLDDQHSDSDLFPPLHDFPHDYLIPSHQTTDSAAEKLQFLVETLKPIPFIPPEALDFKSHESLLRRLGLWDFVNLQFDASIRCDLLAQLIASYTPSFLGGYVNGVKIMVNRAELGRALKLPTEPSAALAENLVGSLESAESVAFIERFVSMWMLLHGDDCVMPPEVLNCIRLIKGGNLEMIDWAGLVWSMVDQELKASQLENCYYASHLQHLIKTQHEELLREDIEVSNKKEEEELLRDHNIELSQGQDDIQICEKRSVDVEDFKEESGQVSLLRQCNASDHKASEEEEFKDDEDDCILLGEMSSGTCSEGMPSESFNHQAMEAGQMPQMDFGNGLIENFEDFFTYRGDAQIISEPSPSSNSEDHGNGLIENSEDFFTYRGDAQLISEPLPSDNSEDFGNGLIENSDDLFTYRGEAQMISEPSPSGNGHERHVDHQDDHNLHQSPTISNKRLRSDDSLSDVDEPVDFNMCMENIQYWMREAKTMYATKAQAFEESSMNQQILLNELQKSDQVIGHLQKAHLEESQKGQLEVGRLQRELYNMGKLLMGYRTALKDTQKAFTEYKRRCSQASEPLHK